MKTELAFDMMEKLLPDIVEISNDADVLAFKQDAKAGVLSSTEIIGKLLPVFVTKHRDAMFHMVSVIEGKTVEEVKEQDFSDTITAIKDGFTGDMINFFVPMLRMVSKL